MSATVETWKGNIAEIGAAYPFVGTEMMWVIAAFVFWIAWHIIQLGQEGSENTHVMEDFIDTNAVEGSINQSHQHTELEP